MLFARLRQRRTDERSVWRPAVAGRQFRSRLRLSASVGQAKKVRISSNKRSSILEIVRTILILRKKIFKHKVAKILTNKFMNMNQKGFTNIILVVVIVILIGVVGYFAFVKKSEPVAQQSTPTPTQATNAPKSNPTPTPTPADPTANWKVYSNTRYAYTIKYPTDWFVDTTYSENDFTQRGPVEDNEFIGGDTGFSNYPNASGYNMENPAPSDLYSVGLMIYRVASNISYDQFISSKHFGYDKKESISINGISAVRLTGVSTDHPVGFTVVNTLVKVGNKMFVFNYSGNPIPQQIKDTANKLINSFTAK
jgi:hypothetical protein